MNNNCNSRHAGLPKQNHNTSVPATKSHLCQSPSDSGNFTTQRTRLAFTDSESVEPSAVSAPPSADYKLRKHYGCWELTFAGERAVFKHEKGFTYVAYLLLNPPSTPMHAVELALNARKFSGEAVDPGELVQQRSLGLDDAEALRNLRERENVLHAILEDENQIEPVKEEAIRELKEIYEFQRKNSWRTRDNAQRCVRAVSMSVKRLRERLLKANTVDGKPNPVLQAFADHIHKYILVPSGRGGGHGGNRPCSPDAGCFSYKPLPGVVWSTR